MRQAIPDRRGVSMEASSAPGPAADVRHQAPMQPQPFTIVPQTADPGPLGLGAFALTTFVLGMFNADLVSVRGLPEVFGLTLAYGGHTPILAGPWGVRNGNTFSADAVTAFCRVLASD